MRFAERPTPGSASSVLLSWLRATCRPFACGHVRRHPQRWQDAISYSRKALERIAGRLTRNSFKRSASETGDATGAEELVDDVLGQLPMIPMLFSLRQNLRLSKRPRERGRI